MHGLQFGDGSSQRFLGKGFNHCGGGFIDPGGAQRQIAFGKTGGSADFQLGLVGESKGKRDFGPGYFAALDCLHPVCQAGSVACSGKKVAVKGFDVLGGRVCGVGGLEFTGSTESGGDGVHRCAAFQGVEPVGQSGTVGSAVKEDIVEPQQGGDVLCFGGGDEGLDHGRRSESADCCTVPKSQACSLRTAQQDILVQVLHVAVDCSGHLSP